MAEPAEASREERIRISSSVDHDVAAGEDGLGFQPYVQAVAQFLTHPDTKLPLTFSIEGKWGSGKSSFILQLRQAIRKLEREKWEVKRERENLKGKNPAAPLFVTFNPWRHEKSEELWTQFALEFIRQTLNKKTPAEARKTYLKLLRHRVIPKKGTLERVKMALTIRFFVAFAGFNALIGLGIYFSGNFNWWYLLGSLTVTGVAGTLASLWERFHKLTFGFFEADYKKGLNGFFSESNVAFIERFHEDFHRIFRIFIERRKKVFVFVDDIDRCETPKAGDLMQWIHLMMSDKAKICFIIGMDREKVAASIAAKHKDVVPHFEGLSPLDYGYTFIDKFIQVPFQVPKPSKEEYRNYLMRKANERGNGNNTLKTWPTAITETPGSGGEETIAEGHPGKPVERPTPLNEPGTAPKVDIERGDVAPTPAPPKEDGGKKHPGIYLGEDSQTLHDITLMVADALDYNPRKIKTFRSLFRLKLCIAAETGLFSQPPGTNRAELTPEKLGKFVAIGLQWPRLMEDLANIPDLLDWLQGEADYLADGDDTSPRARHENHAGGHWSGRNKLMKLLEEGAEGNTKEVFEHRYSMKGLDLQKLIGTSPKTHTLETEPEETTPDSPPEPPSRVLEETIADNLGTNDKVEDTKRHGGPVFAVAITPDGKRAVSGSHDNTLKVWDLDSGKCLKTLRGYFDSVTAVAVTPDGTRAVSGSDNRTLDVWGLNSGHSLSTLRGHSNAVFSVAVSPDGKRAVSGSSDSTLKVWDLDSGKPLKTLFGHSSTVLSVAVTPDGTRAVSGSTDNFLKVWNLKSGECLKTLEGHSDPVRSVAITPDGKHAISGSDDKTLKVWDLDSGTFLKTLKGHSDSVTAVAVTPDGKRAVSASYDKTLKVWYLDFGTCLKTLEGHSKYVLSVAVTPDGKRAVSGSKDKTLKVWDLDSGECQKTLGTPSRMA